MLQAEITYSNQALEPTPVNAISSASRFTPSSRRGSVHPNMKCRILLPAMIGVAGLIVGGQVGFVIARHRTFTYEVAGRSTAVDRQTPNLGIGIGEFTSVLRLLHHGDTNAAQERLEIFLESSIYDAVARHQAASGEPRHQIGQALRNAARYRRDYPRTIQTNPGILFLTGDSFDVVDQYLKQFDKGNPP